MVNGLGSNSGLIRRTFVEGLSVIGYEAVPPLKKALLHHSNVNIRRSAAKALKLIGDPSALPDLLEALINDEDPVVQGSSVGAMAVFGEQAVELLQQVLINKNSTAMQCGLASWGIAFVGADAPHTLRKAARSEHSAIRAAAIGALGHQIQSLADEKARDLLLKALKDEATEVRVEATCLLGKLHETKWAEPLLKEQLFDSKAQVRKNAALSLMKLKAVNSIKSLKEQEALEKDINVKNILRLAINQLLQKNPTGKN